MEVSDTYKTIEQASEGFFKDKGSKFLAYAYPVRDEQEVKEHVARLKKTHHSARHHCYAYRFGTEGENYRMNDDGEPSGTAGRPIHGQLCSYNVSDILIVVVRYFGGTLLGVGGLINAYKKAAAEALQNARIITRTIEKQYLLEFDYPLQSTVSRILKEGNVRVVNEEYGINCRYTISVKLSLIEETLSKLHNIAGLKTEMIKT
ncbi:MAG: IMPACT family protein [Prolixibacteraceae bacterium]|nr:IMPACT family protein [Prolixibacteraceae bacterium]